MNETKFKTRKYVFSSCLDVYWPENGEFKIYRRTHCLLAGFDATAISSYLNIKYLSTR